VEIAQATLFLDLSGDVIARVRDLARVHEYAAGETIFNEGDPADDIYILREGFVELTYTLPQDPSTEIRITRISPGETFAWSALAKGGTLSSHARALVASSAYTIPADRLHAFFAERPEAGYEVMTRLAQQILARLRETRKELRWLHHGAR
jgi:CRP/FNR family transcriptional regulator, cyclic AMP receptor protein